MMTVSAGAISDPPGRSLDFSRTDFLLRTSNVHSLPLSFPETTPNLGASPRGTTVSRWPLPPMKRSGDEAATRACGMPETDRANSSGSPSRTTEWVRPPIETSQRTRMRKPASAGPTVTRQRLMARSTRAMTPPRSQSDPCGGDFTRHSSFLPPRPPPHSHAAPEATDACRRQSHPVLSECFRGPGLAGCLVHRGGVAPPGRLAYHAPEGRLFQARPRKYKGRSTKDQKESWPATPFFLGPWSLVLGPWSLVLGPWSLVLPGAARPRAFPPPGL